MDEIINNVHEDLEDENKLSESSFKTLSDPTIILPHSDENKPVSEATKQQNDTRCFSNKKEQSIELNTLPITHVTLNLNVNNKKATSSVQWKHNFVRKKSNQSPNNLTFQTASVTRSSSVYSKNSKDFQQNPSQQSDYLDTPDYTRPKSIAKSRDSSALSYHITDYKNFEHSRQSLTLQQQQQRQNSIYFRSTPQAQQMRFADAASRQVSYIDLLRSKSSTGESSSSICSIEMPGPRMQKHNYSVAEFNKFKSKLLKNHSRNYYIYDSANLNEGRVRTSCYQQTITQPMFQFQPVNQHNLATNSINKQHSSQIKSIYETIQRANLKKQSLVEARRINYLNSIKNTQEVLSNSLSVTKLN